MSRWVRDLVPGVLFVLLAGVATGCGSTGDDASVETSEASLSGAATTTLDAESARMRLVVGAPDQTVEVFEGVIRFGPEPVLDLVVVGEPGTETTAPNVRAFADAMYLGEDGEWLEIDNDEAADDLGIRFEPGTSPLLGLFEIMLAALDHADPETIRVVGTDELRGVAVTRHEAVVDVGAALRSRGVVLDEATFDEAVALFGPEASVWLDADGRVRRVRLGPSASDPEQSTASITIELWDFGVEVDVERPEVTLFTDEELGATVRWRGDIPETDDAYCEARRRQTVTLAEPTAIATDWIDAAGFVAVGVAIVREGAETAAPDAMAENDEPLVELYEHVADRLDAGDDLARIIADGLRVDGAVLAWDAAVARERRIHVGQAELCSLIADAGS